MSNEGLTLELTAKQASMLSLALGLVVGGFGGFAVGAMSSQSLTGADDIPSGNTQSAGSDDNTPENVFRQISNDLNLNTDTVMQCYQNSSNEEAIEDRNNAIRSVGNFGTPTFFVGNKESGFVKIAGAQPLSKFEEAMATVRSDNPNSSGNLVSLNEVELDGEPSKGDADAPIKVVEYNEFGCPFCAEWQGIDASAKIPIDQMNVAGSLESQYIDTGEVELISKDYPVPQLHPNGPLAHKAANCVYEHEQDSYWEYHDKLFEERSSWMKG